jgi:hypothetical protein
MPYITLAELKDWLDETGSDYDGQLLSAISAAEAMIDRFLGYSFGPKTLTEMVPGSGGPTIFPKLTPVTAVSSCTVDGQAVAVTFNTIGVRRTDGGVFPLSSAIMLTYTGGLPVPDDVKTAMKMTAQAIFSSGDLDANMMGEAIAGAVQGSYQPGGPGSLPIAARTILQPIRRTF